MNARASFFRRLPACRRPVSLKHWFFAVLLLLMVPLLVVMLFLNAYAGAEMRRQTAANNASLLAVYVQQLDSSVLGLNSFLASLPLENDNMLTLMMTRDAQEHYFASINILNELKIDMMLYNRCNGLFVYSENPVRNEMLCQIGNTSDSDTHNDIRSEVAAKIAAGKKETAGWELWEIDGHYYLIRIIRSGSNYCGAWIDVDSLSLPLDSVKFGSRGRAVVTDPSGKTLETAALADGIARLNAGRNGAEIRVGGAAYLQIAQKSQILPVSFTLLIPDAVFSAKICDMQRVIVLSFAVILLAVPFLGYTLNRMLYHPVRRLTDAMEKVQSGNLNVRTPVDAQFAEFNAVSAHFNSMIERIRQLKEDVYEKTILEQRLQLQYLQLQIRPHFFLNAVNVIYSFALVRRDDLIEQMAIALGNHFRYMFRDPMSFVTIGAEVRHIGNYMAIQKLRYEGQFTYISDVDQKLTESRIPPFAIQTFIENSIKYGLRAEGPCTISLLIRSVPAPDGDYADIRVADDGPGYPAGMLTALNGKDPPAGDPTRHIGIRNLRQRLRLIYGEKATLCFWNAPEGGAVSQIRLPLLRQEHADGPHIRTEG